VNRPVVAFWPGESPLAGAALDAPPHGRFALSVVIPAFNEEDCVAETIRRVDVEATRLRLTCEIILVDDGSADATLERARAVRTESTLRVIRLSRNFGKEQAIMAGLAHTLGEAVAILDADLQEPLDALALMLEKRREGFEMVYAVRADREDETRLKRAATRLFYWLMGLGSAATIPPDARDFRVMDRKVVDALCALPERNRFMKGLYGWVGFRSCAVPVTMRPRPGGESKFGARRLAALALTGITAFSDWPLRIWTGIGFGLAALSIVYGGWIGAKTLIWGADVPGWTTLAVAIFFLGGVQLVSIGVLGEYLARVFNEVKARPGFIVAEEFAAGAGA
jgi:glycosyltransferase involved in cell wall biosynthesis